MSPASIKAEFTATPDTTRQPDERGSAAECPPERALKVAVTDRWPQGALEGVMALNS